MGVNEEDPIGRKCDFYERYILPASQTDILVRAAPQKVGFCLQLKRLFDHQNIN